ncbi:MAG: glycosyltransferase, partial [Planctomycetota bacterium]
MTEPRPQIDFQSEPTRVLVFALSLPSWLSSGGGAALMHAARGDRVVCVQVNAAESEEEEKRLRQILGERLELRSLDLPPGELGGVHDLVARLGAVLDSVLLSDGETGARFVIHVPAPPPEQLEARDEDLAALVAALSSALSHRAPHALRVFGSPFAQRHYELPADVRELKLEALERLGAGSGEAVARELCSTLSSERWLERLMAAARVGLGPGAARDGQMRPLGARSGDAFPRATAVVSTWNKRDDVLANLESLRGQTLPFAEIVVVD